MRIFSGRLLKGHFRLLMITALLTTSISGLFGQTRDQIRQADLYYDNGHYDSALEIYQEYCQIKPKDDDVRFRLASCLFELNQLDQAIAHLKIIEEDSKNTEADVLLKLAEAYHQNHAFTNAINYYKAFVAKSDEKDWKRQKAIDEVKRCAIGLRNNYPNPDVLVENLGKGVNSIYDDFQPIESPNHQDVMYFSSLRNATVVDKFSEGGQLASTTMGRDCDMYATEILHGAWSPAFALNPDLNTGQNEILQHFSVDGMIAYFSRSPDFTNYTFMVDTFSDSGKEGLGHIWEGPLPSETPIQGIQFWSDSMLIYAGNQSGGAGGYDLYYISKRKGSWTSPKSFGPEINGSFDQVSPFLSKDGRTLYFSSNDLTSMGGFDIFQSRYDEGTLSWTKPENLGAPINSAGDDLFYRMSSNGYMAYFSSNRKSGHGGQDIYTGYFKSMQKEHLVPSIPALFTQVEEFKLFSESLVSGGSKSSNALDALVRFKMPVLFYRDDEVMTPQNLTKLETLVGFVKTYPHVSLEIVSHSDQLDVSNFDLFFSIKKAEQVASYLWDHGIKADQLYLKGVGGNYPIARNKISNRVNETAQFLNRRIDIRVHHPSQIPLEIIYDLPEVSEAMQTGLINEYYDEVEGLTYRIQFAASDQLFKGDLIGRYDDPCTEKNPDSDLYFYCSGIFSSFEAALQHLTEIKADGYVDAKVVPYVDGLRISNNQMESELLTEFPDLKNYILYLE